MRPRDSKLLVFEAYRFNTLRTQVSFVLYVSF
jgi:hypothetical protein